MAHRIAAGRGLAILSADAMLVYRGMDIGTAKPSAAERAAVSYLGIDLADPSDMFSAGAWLEHVRVSLPDAPVIVAGGTGLYIKALLQGLDAGAKPNPALRAELESLAAERGLEALRQKLLNEHPDWYASVRDRENPRRLIRAIEIAHSGAPPPKANLPPVRITGLYMERGALEKRIARRVDLMYQNGLMEEVRRLREQHPRLSETAAQAIGYAEAAAVLSGKMPLAEAKERTVLRTRQLAKRQMTWFRHQAEVDWIEVKPGMTVGETAEQVCAAWAKQGPVRLNV